ncbi:homocysteine S-methyltransferase [Tistlia consotensis]|uniref:Homocysteine S-methyltransferase n=1 Tax=Tistlia consotensis USBA 355 TaxID=560819 RepID=A0A1Y6BJY6_9PROT|nr:homocysteine S-methyltransferase family protein [Tistlia consotensis]SMF14725.1 homocysteine S-methyltransferase [Tistlia consotensis USBA 355]SNR49293.1 homocysteine S-methyltransferase [Tistlia consotensis]
MSKYRKHLPQTNGTLFLTDGGLETTLVFHDGMDLPCFASFVLMKDEAGRARLRRYYEQYIELALAEGRGMILEAPTWRASADWGERLGYSRAALAEANRAAVALIAEIRDRRETPAVPIVVSGCVGPRGDGYDPGQVMSAEAAEAYHAEQIGSFAEGEADMIGAMTMTNLPEAIGIARAAGKAGLPVAVSFTVETDGRLPTGQTLGEAIETVDRETGRAPAYYMINCAHPTHFAGTLAEGGAWMDRLRGLRANASRRSHAELDSSADLDDGDPVELGGEYRELLRRFRNVTVVGGCCGTDHRHVEAISRACRGAA